MKKYQSRSKEKCFQITLFTRLSRLQNNKQRREKFRDLKRGKAPQDGSCTKSFSCSYWGRLIAKQGHRTLAARSGRERARRNRARAKQEKVAANLSEVAKDRLKTNLNNFILPGTKQEAEQQSASNRIHF